jgi:hypothetical protein
MSVPHHSFISVECLARGACTKGCHSKTDCRWMIVQQANHSGKQPLSSHPLYAQTLRAAMRPP